jgi:hypothetical protein
MSILIIRELTNRRTHGFIAKLIAEYDKLKRAQDTSLLDQTSSIPNV